MDLLDRLSHEDKQLLRQTWTVIEKNINDTACCIFEMIISQSPDTKQLFPFMKVTPVGDAKHSREMEFHALRVMQVLESVVKALDNPSSLDPLCDNLGRVHGRLAESRGFKTHYWSVFMECTLFHIRRILSADHRFNTVLVLDRSVLVWRTVIRILIKRMKVGFTTDLRNRRANREIEGTALSSDSSPVSNLISDISHTLTIADLNGHEKGDNTRPRSESSLFRQLRDFTRRTLNSHHNNNTHHHN
ncbi:hypothetical protein KIN20_000903 [Parelaphostrongylus tenuis]|uniref:Globin domain-containing protein n=1 Tax=Parelaphostrongylus tenuis TaxID=148309 RepID=A0AAD5LW64_PARTN|nr:hypothetical protein KIN20_000903 [Parelaphostrongylus tenuis]